MARLRFLTRRNACGAVLYEHEHGYTDRNIQTLLTAHAENWEWGVFSKARACVLRLCLTRSQYSSPRRRFRLRSVQVVRSSRPGYLFCCSAHHPLRLGGGPLVCGPRPPATGRVPDGLAVRRINQALIHFFRMPALMAFRHLA